MPATSPQILFTIFRDTNDPRPEARLAGYDFLGKQLELKLKPNDGTPSRTLSTSAGTLAFLPENDDGEIDGFQIVDHAAFIDLLPRGRKTALALRLIDGTKRRYLAGGVVDVREDGDVLAATVAMVQVPGIQGPPWINDRGAWEPGTTYAPRDGVTHLNSYWMAVRATTEEPGAGDDWRVLLDARPANALRGDLASTDPARGPSLLPFNGVAPYAPGSLGDGVRKIREKLLNSIAPHEPFPHNIQPEIVAYDFSNAPLGATYGIPPSSKHPLVRVSALEQVNGATWPGVRGATPYGEAKVPGSLDYPLTSFSVGMHTTGTVLDGNAYALTFSIASLAGHWTCLQRLRLRVGYDTGLDTGLYFEPRWQLFVSDDGITFAPKGNPGGLGDLAALMAHYANTGSGGGHYITDKYIVLSKNNDKFLIPPGQTKYFRLALAETGSTSNTRRIVFAKIWVDGTVLAETVTPVHGIIFGNDPAQPGVNRFNGWPANGFVTIGQWGNRVGLSWSSGKHVNNPTGHDQDPEGNENVFAYSDEGGDPGTWEIVRYPNVKVYNDVRPEDVVPRPTLDLSNPDLGLMFDMNWMYWTLNRGQTMQGPCKFSEGTQFDFQNRTSYQIIDGQTAHIYATLRRAERDVGQSSRNRAAFFKTANGFATEASFQKLIGDEQFFASTTSNFNVYSIMPRAVRIEGDHYVVAVRELWRSYKWLSIYETRDAFRTKPKLIARVAQQADNPGHLLKLKDGTLCLVYGSRQNGPNCICAIFSRDEGRTWTVPAIIRQAAATWDFGYPVAFVRTDDKVCAAYYWHDAEHPYQHIACTIFNPEEDEFKNLPLATLYGVPLPYDGDNLLPGEPGVPTVAMGNIVLVYGGRRARSTAVTPAVTIDPVLPGVARCFNIGPYINGTLSADTPTLAPNIEHLVDLREFNDVETPSSGIGLWVGGNLPLREDAIVINCARAGVGYDDLKKGSQPFANLMTAVARARTIGSTFQFATRPTGMVYMSGEAEWADTQAAHYAKLVELQADVSAEWSALDGVPLDVPLVVDQPSSWTVSGLTSTEVVLAQLQAGLGNANIFCMGPMYPFEHNGLDLTPASTRLASEFEGRALSKLQNGLYISSAVRTGAVIVLTYAGGDTGEDIVLDTDMVSNPGQYGFEWRQTGGTARVIQSITKGGRRKLTITLSGDPGVMTAAKIAYAMTGVADAPAGPLTGPRGNVRDESQDESFDGFPMYNWACHQIVDVI